MSEKMMKCRICSVESKEIFSAVILKQYNIKYYLCTHCNFLQTENPFWLKESYQSAIADTDTGILKRNNLFAKRSSAIIAAFFNPGKKFLDFAGGYGIFVRMMRDSGFDFYWYDAFAENLFARGFEFNKSDEIELVTAFECFEHFTDPVSEIQKMLDMTGNIIFSTRIFHGLPPKPDQWWYYSLNSGQHISFYSINTLKFLAKKFKLHLNSDNRAFHMLTTRKINNFFFNAILKISDAGLSRIFTIGIKSKTDADHELLSGRK